MQMTAAMAAAAADIVTNQRRTGKPLRERPPGQVTRAVQEGKVPRPPHEGLVGTMLVAGLNNAPLAAARLVLPMIALAMGASTPMIGLMASLFSLAPMLFNVHFGRWVDRVGTWRPVVFSTALILLSCLLFELFPSREILLPMAALVGAGAMFSHAAATRAVGDIGTTDTRPRNLGYLAVTYALFQFLGPMAAGFAYEGWGAAVAVAAMGGFAVLTGVALTSGRHNFTSSAKETRRSESAGRTAELFEIPRLLRLLVIYSIFAGVQAIYPFIVALHTSDVGLSAAQAGMILGAFAGGSLISRLAVGLVTRLLHGPTVVLLALTCGGLAYAALPLLHGFAPLLALSSGLGFAIGLGAPISLALIYEAAPAHRINESFGLGMAMTNLLQTVLPLSLGLVASGAGVGAMTWVLSLAMLLAAAAAVRGGTR